MLGIEIRIDGKTLAERKAEKIEKAAIEIVNSKYTGEVVSRKSRLTAKFHPWSVFMTQMAVENDLLMQKINSLGINNVVEACMNAIDDEE